MDSTRRLWLAFLLLLVPVHARAQDKLYRPELTAPFVDSMLRTDWYGVYLKDDTTKKDRKVGYLRSERKRSGDTIIDEQFMALKLISFDQKLEFSQTQTLTFSAAAPYRMLRAVLVDKKGQVEETTTFAWNEAASGYDSVHTVGNAIRKQLVRDIDFTLADDIAIEHWMTRRPQPGDVIRSRLFDPSEAKLDLQVNKIVSSKESLVGGVKVHFYEVDTLSKLHEIKTLSRYDDQGTVLSAIIAIFELRKEPEAQAKNTEYSQDLFVLGMAKINQGLGQTDRLRELVVEIGGKEGEVLEDGPRQSVTDENGKRLLRLGKRYGKQQKATAADIQEALAETNAYPIANPKVKALADKVTAGARTDEEKVAKIVAFVHDFIRPRLSGDVPNIHDLLERKQGDCKSYALMFNNLARAAGVPSREVAGLLYVGDDVKAFAGHAWNEVVLNGVWVPVDASLGETELDAGHICFGTDHKASSKMLSSLGKLSFRLVEVKSAP
jgi:hypothetical protein